MQQIGQGTATTKLDTGIAQLVGTLKTLGSTRWVLIDSDSAEAREIESPEAILSSPSIQPASTTSSLPAMLQAAHDYIKNNRTGQTEVWICSDLRANDWDAQSGRWKSLRDSFQTFKQGVRFHLLAYPSAAPEDIAVRVTNVERQTSGNDAAVLLSLHISRGHDSGKARVPVRFEIDGATSEVTFEFEGREHEIKNHRIPIAGDRVKGWGRVSIPGDVNTSNNEFFFVFDDPPPRRTILVAEEGSQVRPLELAAGIAADPAVKCEVETIDATKTDAVQWNDVALLLWQAQLPSGEAAEKIKQFVDRGGRVVFFPPKLPNKDSFFDVHWTSWSESPEPERAETWWGDADLLARTQSGAAVPVGEILVRRHCGLDGEFTPLATLPEGRPLLARVTTDRGGVYFCTTTAAMDDASLGTDGVALYVMVQRALAAGADELGNSLQLEAGDALPSSGEPWGKLAGSDEVLSTEFSNHAGTYSAGERLLAVNRKPAEDVAKVLTDAQVSNLFRGLDFDRVDDQAGNMASLTREVWRIFLISMLIALVAEAGLCIPRLAPAAGVAT